MAVSLKSAMWKIAKAGIIMGTVGVLLAAVAPLLAMAIPGMLETTVTSYAEAAKALAPGISPAWTGLFFGAFGALHAAVDPVESWLFKKTGDAVEKTKEKLHLKEPQISLHTQVALPEQEQTTKHRDMIAKQKIILAEQSRAVH